MWKQTKISCKYYVSKSGEIKGPSGKILKPLLTNGYLSVAISLGDRKVKREYVHKLVYEAYNAIPSGYVINHKNHNKLDNRICNLECITRSDNTKHWRKTKKYTFGRKVSKYCDRGHYKQGKKYCNVCRRTKNPEPPKQYNWKPYYGYLISDCGKAWSKTHYKLLKPGINIPGYKYYNLRINGKTVNKSVHRLVAECFIGNIDNLIVDHIDGNKHNNNVSNLRIITQSENMKHCYANR